MGTKRNIRRGLLVLQTLLLILLALSGTLIVLLRLGNAEAAQTGELPEIGGFRYYIVAENAQPELPKGALLLLDPVQIGRASCRDRVSEFLCRSRGWPCH